MDNVVKNPLLRALEREERVVDPNQDAEDASQHGKINLVREARLERSQGVDTDAFREGLEKGNHEISTPSLDLYNSVLTLSSSWLFLIHSLAAKQAVCAGIIVLHWNIGLKNKRNPLRLLCIIYMCVLTTA